MNIKQAKKELIGKYATYHPFGVPYCFKIHEVIRCPETGGIGLQNDFDDSEYWRLVDVIISDEPFKRIPTQPLI